MKNALGQLLNDGPGAQLDSEKLVLRCDLPTLLERLAQVHEKACAQGLVRAQKKGGAFSKPHSTARWPDLEIRGSEVRGQKSESQTL
jgi:hypothetical protein